MSDAENASLTKENLEDFSASWYVAVLWCAASHGRLMRPVVLCTLCCWVSSLLQQG